MSGSVLWCLISSAAAEALREGSEGNVPKRGPHDAASFFGRHCSGRRSHKKHVSSEAVAYQHSSLSPRPERLCSWPEKYRQHRRRRMNRDYLSPRYSGAPRVSNKEVALSCYCQLICVRLKLMDLDNYKYRRRHSDPMAP